jgi:hypothetical protein
MHSLKLQDFCFLTIVLFNFSGHHDIWQNDTQNNDTQQNETQQNDTQYNIEKMRHSA